MQYVEVPSNLENKTDKAKRDLDSIINLALQKRPEFIDCKAIIGFGSQFNGSKYLSLDSDVDLLIFQETKFFIKKTILFENTKFDLTICSFKTFNSILINTHHRDRWIESMSKSSVIYDPERRAESILSKIRSSEVSSKKLIDIDVRAIRSKINNILRKLKSNGRESYFLATETGLLVELCYEFLCKKDSCQRFYDRSLRHNHIKESYPKLYSLVMMIVGPSTTMEKISTISSFVDELFKESYVDVPEVGVTKKSIISIDAQYMESMKTTDDFTLLR